MSEQRFVKAEFAAWVGIVANLLLAIMKGVVGWLANSKALLADAANSASDVVGSAAVLFGFRAAKLPPDEDHPYGHGKAESIAAIVVSVLVLLVGFEIGLSAIKTMISGIEKPPEWFALAAILVAIVVKEVLFRYNYKLGKQLKSQALIASAWDHRTDVYSSLAVFAGVFGARMGNTFDMPILYYMDPLAGLFVALLVLRTGYKLIMESIHKTMDHVLHQEDAEELVKTVQRVKGVIAVDNLRAREHGHYVVVDVKISVNPRISVMEGHDIGKAVKQQLMKRFIHVSDVFIHVNPYDPGYPYKANVDPDHDDFPSVLH
ncbi:cation diffusion facilitator family transporter [Paenibacillus sp. MBLB4367]|uniref:cation diffusion facilitator family transporter n=1 Tax=Paenibacillus sp. MBLB4367 TaxID=3384767 RepID=UPI003908007E